MRTSKPKSGACFTLIPKVAFLVGVNQYEKRGFINLDYAESDMEKLGAELKKFGFKVVLLKGSLPNENPLRATKRNIETQLNALLKDSFITKDSIVLVAFSGHGEQLRETKGNGKVTDENFLCPVDAVSGVAETQFSLSQLTDEILAKKGGKNLVLVDACRKVAEKKSKGIQGNIAALPEDTAVLFSCRAGQESAESAILEQGLFTHCVLTGLRGEAAKGGIITWPRLVSHVQEQMASEKIKSILKGDLQEPIQAGGVRLTVIGTLSVQKSFAGSKAGELFSTNGLSMKFRWCPPGTFTMGSPESEKNPEIDEDQVKVTLTKGFWLGQHEVTQGEWEKLMGTTPWKGKSFVKEGSSYAASYVSWNDAVKFCEKLTDQERKTGRLPVDWSYTLPTEAQWEYACRAGTTTRFSFGADESKLSEYAWWGGIVGDGNAKNEKYAHEVGQRKPNAWNLYDLHGNVWEWCRDWYQTFLPGGTDPEVTEQAHARVFRGGGWLIYAGGCRSAKRGFGSSEDRYDYLGFRLALKFNPVR